MCPRRVTWFRAFAGLLLLMLTAGAFAIKAQTGAPILISDTNSTRAVALESVMFTPEPFATTSPHSWNADHRTRIMLFALNLPTQGGQPLYFLNADAEDAAHHHYSLLVEYFGPVPNQPWLTPITILLNEDIKDAGDVLVRISYLGTLSNRVRVAIGHKGGGPPDDAGAGPTPAPPYALNGKVTDDDAAFSGLSLKLTGSQTETTSTNAGGAYEFSVNAIGGSYTITPVNQFYNFNPISRTVNDVTNNQLDLDFVATRKLYTISGVARDSGGQGLAGVDVSLSGAEQKLVTTDGSGNFSFSNLKAGGNYALAFSKTHYVLTPANQTFTALDGNQTINVQGVLRNYFLAGKVRDNSGQGIAGITITLSGSQNGLVHTGSDGSYSIPATAFGSYSLTPSIEQDWFTFAPGNQSIVVLTSDQTLNFVATAAPPSNPSYVLEFDGSPKAVDYGYLWDPGRDLGHFFWEFWAMPGSNSGATYLLSDGYGGAHALLFGFANLNTSEPGRYQLIGNLLNDVTYDNYFHSDEGPAPGEWGHYAVGWDGRNVITYFNGVPVGKTAFTGPRFTPGPDQGGSWLLIGGSTHSNFQGRIAQVRGYERNNPREDPTGANQTLVESSFAPQTIFSQEGNLTSRYFRPAPTVADLSQGYFSFGHPDKFHSGLLRGLVNGYFDPCSGCSVPQFVVDPTAPDFTTATAAAQVSVDAPAPVPSGARVFDSFSRANSTYVLNGKGGLGSTEGGTAGPKVWQTNQAANTPQPFGILNGRAVLLANGSYPTWIATAAAAANLETRVDRHAGINGSGLDTGLSFRVVDERNFFFAYTSSGANDASPRQLTVGFYLNGVRTNLAGGVNLPSNWTTLRAITKASGELSIYAGGTLLFTTSNNNLANAVGCGLYNNSAGLGLVNRWDNFTVLDAP
ncbi:MAG: hypothetical protein QOE77_2823 [Blastocatellia bacterium]|jgi:hypothetical protein|nr:hypothetical protein [Blastocatellia bacterium]